VQEIAEEIRRKTGAEFVVVGDHEGRRLAHPDPEKIGRFMVGGDNRPALEEGRSYVSKAVGTLGPSIRGKTPVFTKDGRVIGVVSVGYLQEDVRAIIREAQLKTFPLLALVFLVGIGGAIMIAKGLKEAIFGLEPEEIANLLQQRTAFLESIREGVVACNADGRVSLVNTAALAQMGLASSREVLERPVAEVLPEAGMEKVLDSGVQRLDEELALGGHQMIFNLIPLRNNDQVNGVVASFRRKDEIDVLARELSSVRQYADMLRAQAHEHSNQLHTIAGLIQLESYDEALELIVSQEASFQEFVGLLTRIAPDPILSALIIGKFNHAQENDVELVLDPDSDRLDPPAEFDRNRLVTILGNLLDNACEAARTVESRPHRVRLQLGQTADELCFAVDDSGPGIPDDLAGRIFDKGISGKNGANRGVGLFLVQRALKKLGGRIEVETSELGGARFSVQIPKQTRR
jgi:sensor histidine kinase regulating citrate/malate metabolism